MRNVGGQPYWSWHGFDSRVEWCACFVSWCANESGCLGTMVPKFSRCTDGVAWFRGQGRWKDSGYLPQPGEIIFFDWNGDMVPDHVGIVEKVDGGVIYTIEGNSAGDRCWEKRYVVGNSLILGYGISQLQNSKNIKKGTSLRQGGDVPSSWIDVRPYKKEPLHKPNLTKMQQHYLHQYPHRE